MYRASEICLLSALSVLLLAPDTPRATAGIKVELVSQWGGGTNDVVVSGSTVFMSVGGRLVVLDVADPTAPKPLNTSIVLPGAIYGLAIDGQKLYAAVNYAGLYILDISDSSAPKVDGFVRLPSAAYGVSVRDNYAYVVGRSFGLQIVDVYDSHQPHVVGSGETAISTSRVALIDHYAYVSNYFDGIEIYDVADPSAPVLVKTWGDCGHMSVTFVDDTTAYVTDLTSFQILNVTDRENPVLIGECFGGGEELVSIGRHAFSAAGSDGLMTFDVVDRHDPRQTWQLDVPGYGYGIAAQGDTIFLAAWNGGLRVFDVSNPNRPKDLSVYDEQVSAQASSFSYANGVGVIAEGWPMGVQIIDLNDLSVPRRLSHMGEDYSSLWVRVADKIAYLARGTRGVAVIDLANPSAPKLIKAIDTPGIASKVHLDGSVAYIADADGGAQLIDIYEREIIGSFRPEGEIWFVTAQSNRMYVYDSKVGLRIADVSDPRLPNELGRLSEPGYLAIAGHAACITGIEMRIVDVSDPARPETVGSHSQGATMIACQGHYAFTTRWGRDLEILDISEPSQPQVVAASGDMVGARDLTVSGSLIFGAALDGGVYILKTTISADVNCDGYVDFRDIDPFVELMTAPDEYAAHYPLCNPSNGDIDEDGDTTFADIDGFVGCLIAGGCD